MSSDESFKIYIDQLRDGHVTIVDEAVNSDFLDIHERDLFFRDPVYIKGEVYLAGQELVFHLALRAISVVPCVICNTPVEVEISLPNVYEVVPLDEIPHGIFHMDKMLREAILLETKAFVECNEGHCPQRRDIARYLKKDKPPQIEKSPFEDLTLEE